MSVSDQTDSMTQSPQAQKAMPPQKKKSFLRRLFWMFFWLIFVITPLSAATYYVLTIYPTLPDASKLKDVTFQVPLKIVTKDGKLITEIGTKRRIPLDYTEIPEMMTQAIISAEDANFFQHNGVDYKGIGRAVFELISTGSKQTGGSTITMQVARNFFLTKERTFLRKFNEIILSFKIERQISKQEILALYLNKIFLGHRSYGVAAAARTYYNKTIDELTLDEFAMIAGLPKAPSAFNPVTNPQRAKIRRNYVLRRMFENNYITEAEMLEAQAIPVHARLTGARIDIEVGYVAEMSRLFALNKFGPEALEGGLTIVTTIDSKLQYAANLAVRNGLQEYERRRGYRGAIKRLAPTQLVNKEELLKELNDIRDFGGLKVAAVLKTDDISAEILIKTGETSRLKLEDIKWARPYISVNRRGKVPAKMTDVIKTGDLIFVQWLNDSWQLAQDPKTESALVSISPNDGRVLALVGGFDFFRSKFNRATMASRQVGSSIKPFLYSAALDQGMTAATTINDAPVVFHDANLEDTWRPENYSGRFYGPTRLRKALVSSRNLVSIRLLQQLGIRSTSQYMERFGFPEEELKAHRNLSLSLGSVQFTPWQVTQAYATFANTGFLIEPYFIKEVKDYNGSIIYSTQPLIACTQACDASDPLNAPRVITAQNAYIITSMLQDATRYGSGRLARKMGRQDIAGKTGTTNDQKDAWFAGYNPDIVTTVWAGFDIPSSLGRNEVGGLAALPIWINYMDVAIKHLGSPNAPILRPTGLVNVPIDRQTGIAIPADTPGAYFEIFRKKYAPQLPEVNVSKMKDLAESLFD